MSVHGWRGKSLGEKQLLLRARLARSDGGGCRCRCCWSVSFFCVSSRTRSNYLPRRTKRRRDSKDKWGLPAKEKSGKDERRGKQGEEEEEEEEEYTSGGKYAYITCKANQRGGIWSSRLGQGIMALLFCPVAKQQQLLSSPPPMRIGRASERARIAHSCNYVVISGGQRELLFVRQLLRGDKLSRVGNVSGDGWVAYQGPHPPWDNIDGHCFRENGKERASATALSGNDVN